MKSTTRASTMEDKKKQLVALITEENVSALQTMEDELELTHDEAVALLHELVSEGTLTGSISADESRFWKSDIKLSHAPVLHREDALPPDFLTYDTRPGKIIALIGFLMAIGGFVILNTAGEASQQDIGAIIIFVGAIALLCGLFLISRRNTPD